MSTTKVDLDTLLQERLEGHFGSELFIEAAATGDQLTQSDLKAIRRWTRTDIPAEDLYVFPCLAIDTAPTRNMVIYSEDSQRKSVNKWRGITFLFNKNGTNPGLFSSGADHALQAASQHGRIFKSSLVKTPKGTIGTLVWVYTVKGVSEEVDAFIRKIDAGILREVSIHVQASEVICSICQVPFKDDKEGHYPGETYNGKVCYMETSGPVTPLELSCVACPGSVAAHVMDDDEVDNYTVLSLREALGGSREAIAAIKENLTVDTLKCTHEGCDHVAESAELLSTHAESHQAPAPGAELEEGKTKNDADPPEDEEDSSGDPDDDDGGSGGARVDGKGKKTKQSALGSLFEGDCPACGRGAQAESTPAECKHEFDAQVAEIREEAAGRVNVIMETVNTRVTELEATANANKEKADERDALFAEYVADTVTQAIAKGVKEDSHREDYTTELAALSYPAVKQIRETLAAVTAPPQTKHERLQSSMQDQFKRNFGGTQVVTENGQTKVTPVQRPRLASKIGPGKK